MSNQALNLVFTHSRSKGTNRLVLLAIADRINDAGECWPTVKDIARRANVGARATQQAITSLMRLGELQVDNRKGGRPQKGRRITTTYRLNIRPEKGAQACAVSEPVDSEKGAPEGKKGRTGAYGKGAPEGKKRAHTCAPEPSLNQQQEPTINPESENRFANSGDAAAAEDREAVSESAKTETARTPETTADPTEQAPADRRGSHADRIARVAAKLERSADRWRAIIPPEVRSRIEQIESERFTIATKTRKSEAESERLWALKLELQAILKSCRAACIEADRRGSAIFNRNRAEKQRKHDECTAKIARNYAPSAKVQAHARAELMRVGADEAFANLIAARLGNEGQRGIAAVDEAVAKLAASGGVKNPGGWLRAHFRREGWITATVAPRIPNRDRTNWRLRA